MRRIQANSVLKGLVCLFLLIPVFISLDLSNGVRFDANPFNKLLLPSIPLSVLFIVAIAPFYYRVFFAKYVFFLALSTLLYLLLNLLTGIWFKPVVIFLGMLLPIVTCEISKRIKFRLNENSLFFTLLLVVGVKFTVDVVFYSSIATDFLIHESVKIYNFYDYFPIIYFLLMTVSLDRLIKRESRFMAVVAIAISLLCIFDAHSKVNMVLSIILPFVYFLSTKFVNVSRRIILGVLVASSFLLTCIIMFMSPYISDSGTLIRVEHWRSLLYSFDIVTIVFPFLNEYRIVLGTASLHNEFLELYSYYGLSSFVFYFVLAKYLLRIDPEHRVVFIALSIVIFIGGVVQNNVTQPYSGVLIGLILGVYTKRSNRVFMERAQLPLPARN